MQRARTQTAQTQTAKTQRAKRRMDPLALLARVSGALAASLDYETTLSTVARLAMPFFGNWCAVDICESDGSMRRLAVIHPDPVKQALARKLADGWPPERDDPIGVPAVMRTRRTVTVPHVTDALLVQVARTPANLETLRALGLGSFVTVPLLARDAVLGAITFVSAQAGHQYSSSDTALAEELAARAALAIDNARLYRDAVGRAEAEVARTEAERANMAKTDFLATMSHELRTPLNAIAGYAELLEMGVKGPITEAQREFVQRIQRSERRLLGLINGVLQFARIESGQVQYRLAPVSVDDLLAGVEELVAPQIAAKGLRLTRSCSPSVIANVDREKVDQIVLNLLSNAAKFTPPGGAITVECDGRPGAVEIRVRDTGPGIPSGKLGVIFDPFVQVDSSLTRVHEGTGLGLAISRYLARAMGGDITVDSTPGAGSVFSVLLPSATDAPQPAGAAAGLSGILDRGVEASA